MKTMDSTKLQRKGRKKRWTKDDTELSLLAAPTVVWYLLFAYLPMFGLIIAFKNFKIHGNFIKVFFQANG